VFTDDMLRCSCGGRRSVIAVITDTTIARSLLAALDLSHVGVRARPRPAAGRDRLGRAGVTGVPAPNTLGIATVCPRVDETSLALHWVTRHTYALPGPRAAPVRAIAAKPRLEDM
jgi:hypothetical protein